MPNQNKLTDYVSIINKGTYSNKPFKTTRFRCEFAVENIEEASNPEDVLKECLQYCIDQTITVKIIAFRFIFYVCCYPM